MLNFTVGPVMEDKEVLNVGAQQIPYFRTREFSEIMFENERLIKKFAKSADDARVVFITGSGTASMEAAVINSFTTDDILLIVNGGSFGQRFVDICDTYNIPYVEIKLRIGESLKQIDLDKYDGQKFTGFLVNVHETSTGVLYDLDMISRFCKKNNIYLVVDAVSSFLADEFNMKELGVDVMITGSQKALACPPGISILVLSRNAVNRIEKRDIPCFYLNIKNALRNGERGQTPFTPAVGILLQINTRLNQIEKNGGVDVEIDRIRSIADDFRNRIKDLPLSIVPESMSNAVTALHPLNVSSNDVVEVLKKDYGIWVCPNGGEMEKLIFRVGHIGALSKEDNVILVNALYDLVQRSYL